jgi:hypothetical protein
MDIHAQVTLLGIVAAHLVADFWLQRGNDVDAKRRFRRIVGCAQHRRSSGIAAR